MRFRWAAALVLGLASTAWAASNTLDDIRNLNVKATAPDGQTYFPVQDLSSSTARRMVFKDAVSRSGSGVFEPACDDLTEICALTTTSFGRGFLPLADAAAARTYIGAGTGSGSVTSIDVSGGGTGLGTTGGPITGSGTITINGTLNLSSGGTGAITASGARSNLGLVIGTNVQAFDAGLLSLAALPTAADRYAYSTAADTWAEGTITAHGRSLLDDADAAATISTLGLGALATAAYPGAGIPNSTGSAWGTSYTTTGTGSVVALQTSPAFTTPSLGVATGTSLDLSGHAAIGSAASVSSGYGLAIEDASTANAAYTGLHVDIDSNPTAGSHNITGVYANADTSSDFAGVIIGGQFIGTMSGASPTATSVYGLLAGTSTVAGSTATNAYGAYLALGPSGTITNKIGLRIDSVTGATNNWAIQSAGGQSYHVGNLRIGSTTAPTVALDVTGAAKVSTSLDVPKLANLTSNGFVKTGSGDGTLSVDTTTYLDTTTAASTYQPLDSDLTSWAGVTRASGFDTFAATPSSANLRSLLTDEVGTGAAVFQGADADFATLDLTGKVTTYNNLTTAGGGVASIIAEETATAQAAAVASNDIVTAPATGFYRVNLYLQVTQAATTSSVLAGFAGASVTYNDGYSNVAQSRVFGLTAQSGTVGVGNNGNTTGTSSAGSTVIYAHSGTAIKYAIGYSSTGATAMQYAYHISVEAL